MRPQMVWFLVDVKPRTQLSEGSSEKEFVGVTHKRFVRSEIWQAICRGSFRKSGRPLKENECLLFANGDNRKTNFAIVDKQSLRFYQKQRQAIRRTT